MIKVYFITLQSYIIQKKIILINRTIRTLVGKVKKTKGFAMLPRLISNSWIQANKAYTTATLG